MALRHDAVADAYFVATAEAARGRGYGAARMRPLAADSAISGCDTAILQSSEQGLGVYGRLGYRTVSSCPEWTPRAS